ncbi:hypothetical protein STEG23_033784 [Scotinomys teguina]
MISVQCSPTFIYWRYGASCHEGGILKIFELSDKGSFLCVSIPDPGLSVALQSLGSSSLFVLCDDSISSGQEKDNEAPFRLRQKSFSAGVVALDVHFQM